MELQLKLMPTKQGLAHLADARSGGFKLDVTEFAVGDYLFSSDQRHSEDSTGLYNQVYRGFVNSIEVVTSNSVLYDCQIASDVEINQQTLTTLTEIALYLDNGVLFAVGHLPNLQRFVGLGLALTPVVAVQGIAQQLDLKVEQVIQMLTSKVSTLPDPKTSQRSMYLVADGASDLEHPDHSSAEIAVRYGPGNESWAFIGHNRVGLVSPLQFDEVDHQWFTVDPTLNGFWLNDGETVIVQVVNGAGQGQTRRATYHKLIPPSGQNVWSIKDIPLSGLDQTSRIAIWRDKSSTLPDRRGVDPNFVLHAGEDSLNSTWDTTSPVPGKLSVTPYSTVATEGQYQFKLPSNLPQSYRDRNNLLVFIDGQIQTFNEFSVYENYLYTVKCRQGQRVSLLLFSRSDSDGSSFQIVENYINYGQVSSQQGKPTYNLPFVPDSIKNLFAFSVTDALLGLQSSPDWSLTGASLIFNSNPQSDLWAMAWANKDVRRGYSRPLQYEWFIGQHNIDNLTGTVKVKLSVQPADKTFMLWVKRQYVPVSKYRIENGYLTFKLAEIPVSVGDYLRFVLIANYVLEASGKLTAEPKPINVVPNKLVQHQVQYVSGTGVRYRLPAKPLNEQHIFCYVYSAKQDYGVDFEMVSETEIRFTPDIPADYPVDIVVWAEETGSPQQLTVLRFQFAVNHKGNNRYLIPRRLDDPDWITVNLSGAFAHRDWYTVTANTDKSWVLEWVAPIPPDGTPFEVMQNVYSPVEECHTVMETSKPNPEIGLQRFNAKATQASRNNTFVFVGPVMQMAESYDVLGSDVQLDQSVPYALASAEDYADLQVSSYAFRSGRDLTNLEYELELMARASKPARNTGPYWADPAGVERDPNLLVPSVTTYIVGEPGQKFSFKPPYTEDAIMVFTHGLRQYQELDWDYQSLGQLAFKQDWPKGYPVDIVTWQTVDTVDGYETQLKVFNFVAGSSNLYEIPLHLPDESRLLVFFGGLYAHRSWYRVTAQAQKFGISFLKMLPAGVKITVLLWDSVKAKQSYTQMLDYRPEPSPGLTNFVMPEDVDKNNTMVFVGPLFLTPDEFEVNRKLIQLDGKTPHHLIAPARRKDLPISLVGFRTGESATRLITRQEANDNFLSRFGGQVEGPIHSRQIEPEADSEFVTKAYADRAFQQVAALESLVQQLIGQTPSIGYQPKLVVGPTVVKVGQGVTIQVVNAAPGKQVELEVKGGIGSLIERSVKGITKLDGTYQLGPVGIDSGYSDTLVVSAWVDGFKVVNTVSVKVIDDKFASTGKAMVAVDKPVYAPYEDVVYSIFDGKPNGVVSWAINGGERSALPASANSKVGVDGTWIMKVAAGGIASTKVVEFFVDGQSVGSVSVVVNPNADGKVAKVSVQNTVIQRDGVLNITVEQAEANSPVYFSARGMKTETSGPVDAAGVCDGTGKLNFSYRFTVAGEYVLFIEISGKLYTDTLKVQPISTLDKLIEEYPAGTRAYTKYEG